MDSTTVGWVPKAPTPLGRRPPPLWVITCASNMTCLYILPWINESPCQGLARGSDWILVGGMVNESIHDQGHDPNWIWIWIYPVWDSMIYPVLRGGIPLPDLIPNINITNLWLGYPFKLQWEACLLDIQCCSVQPKYTKIDVLNSQK